MPVAPTYPGVYIEELTSPVHTIIGVATSITAFVGRAARGLVNEPIRVQSFGEFERKLGGLSLDSAMGYAVDQFFQNGGSDALIVRVVHTSDPTPANNAAKSVFTVGTLTLEAASEGTWGDALRVRIDTHTSDPTDATLFNLSVKDMGAGVSEMHRNVSTDPASARYVTHFLEDQSRLVRVRGAVPAQAPPANPDPPQKGADPFSDATPQCYVTVGTKGNDGVALTDTDLLGDENAKTGLYALEKADLFNILCIPPLTREPGGDVAASTWSLAATYCEKRRAILLVDPPATWGDVDAAESGVDTVAPPRSRNAAVYFPRIRVADALRGNTTQEFVPCGAIAGIFARTDTQRGVWKAPAGIDATLNGVQDLTYKLTDRENGRLNPIGVSCLRTFNVIGNVVWGARTMRGADLLTDQWKYVPVRRLALFLEESLFRGTQWVVFEPNDEPLWSQIRLNVGAFLHSLFRQGAFQGRTPREAYFVKCDKDTTTQNDIDQGVVNVVVGFAPLKPAEFVIIQIQQIAGQLEV